MLHAYIKQHNISVYSLSKKTNIPYTTINELVRGERRIDQCSVFILNSLAKQLNLSMDELYSICNSREKINKNLYPFFWDCEVEKLNIIENRTYIITRLLSKGGYEGFKFVINNFTYQEIKEVARTSRNLTPKLASFLMNIYSLDKNEMNYYKFNNFSWR